MTQVPGCLKPVSVRERVEDAGFNIFVDYSMADYINQGKPYMIDFEPLSRCTGSCSFCYAGSTGADDFMIPKEKICEVIDDAHRMGIRLIQWCGGDFLLHPDWYEIMGYLGEKGMTGNVLSSVLTITRKVARQLVELHRASVVQAVPVHLTTIDQAIYDRIHTNPRTLQAKIQGYRNLLEAGFPSERIMGIMTILRPAMESLEQTVDWFIDEMGAQAVCMPGFKFCGFAGEHRDWEPTLADMKRAMDYRAQKLGAHWLKIGASDGSFFYCRVNLAILYDGSVVPCTMMRELVAGNIYQQRLPEIFEAHRDELLFNYEIKGHCGNGECEHGDICFGCRATAYHYLGDPAASDPKCYLNPGALNAYSS